MICLETSLGNVFMNVALRYTRRAWLIMQRRSVGAVAGCQHKAVRNFLLLTAVAVPNRVGRELERSRVRGFAGSLKCSEIFAPVPAWIIASVCAIRGIASDRPR